MLLSVYSETISLPEAYRRPDVYDSQGELIAAVQDVLSFLISESGSSIELPDQMDAMKTLLREILNRRPPDSLPPSLDEKAGGLYLLYQLLQRRRAPPAGAGSGLQYALHYPVPL